MISKKRKKEPQDNRAPRQKQRTKAVADFERWRARTKKGATPATKLLTDKEVNRLVHETR